MTRNKQITGTAAALTAGAMLVASTFQVNAFAASAKPWIALARSSQSEGFRILPLIAITQAVTTDDFDTADRERALKLARRLASTPGTSIAATTLAAALPEEVTGRDWRWFSGLAELSRNNESAAAAQFGQVRRQDPEYLRARFQLALIAYKNKRVTEAETTFREILAAKPAPDADLEDLTKMALGRIYYEERKFKAAAAVYRTVSRDGRNFPVALFEQAWAFFMAGYPNHALGALHGAESPFFAERFNPEATMLRSMILFWMCLYPQSARALEEFIARHSAPIEQLENFLARQQLTPGSAWDLFENLMAGVSSESLGIPRTVLLTAANHDTMIPVRSALALTTQEIKMAKERQMERGQVLLQQHYKYLQHIAGRQFIAALDDMRSQYQRLREQADFLYVELLTSEKDKILGKEHLVSEKFSGESKRGLRPAGWGKQLLAWAPDNKQEYWWDEVGFYIDPAKPACMKK